MVTELSPGLLIIDPLRYAVDADSSDERSAVNALDKVSELRNLNPTLAVILLHHLKKTQDNFTPVLRNDPRAWIERVYGSQALLAHVETIWGLEHDDMGYALGTVSRSEDSFVLGLEKEESSQRFKVSPISVQLASLSPALRQAWDRLPSDFSWTEATRNAVQNSTLGRLVGQAVPSGLLTQDPVTKRYRKVADGGSAGEVGEREEAPNT
jgi:hypothetical protein